MAVKYPCKECKKRFPACHDTCEEYKAVNKARYEYAHELNNERYKGRLADDTLISNAEKRNLAHWKKDKSKRKR